MFVCVWWTWSFGASRPQDQRRISDDRAQRMDENWKTAQALQPPKWTELRQNLGKTKENHVKNTKKDGQIGTFTKIHFWGIWSKL